MSEKLDLDQPAKQMFVRKRNGSLEPVDINKILRAITRCAEDISDVDPSRVAVKTISGLYDGTTTRELDQLSIKTAASLIREDANYSKLAASLLSEVIQKEVRMENLHSFSHSITHGFGLHLIDRRVYEFVSDNAHKLNNAVRPENDRWFEYYGLENVVSHYILRDATGCAIETPQYFFMRVAVANTKSVTAAIALYRKISKGDVVLDPAWVTAGLEKQEPAVAPFRPLAPGMGQAVAERTILRKKESGEWETWGDVAERVAVGNASLASTANYPSETEYQILRKHLANANTLMSGRHLQHGDEKQKSRNMEVFTNCSTSAVSFLQFYLLLNGSGVGRSYDDDMILVNWDNAPSVRCVLDSNHPDFVWGTHEALRDAVHKYGAPEDMVWFDVLPGFLAGLPPLTAGEVWKNSTTMWEERTIAAGGKVGLSKSAGKNVIWFQVPDSREGWAKGLELWETLAFEKIHANTILILDFTPVRPSNLPIGGMQNRPASGPVPLMNAFMKAASLKGAGIDPWKQGMYVDHYFAECVLVGGARRAARMSTKSWRDKSVLDFIRIKRPVEYTGKDILQIMEIRKTSKPQGFLWSSNNSITVDAEFWQLVSAGVDPQNELSVHAHAVFNATCESAYADGTGEPGFINVDKLVQKDAGLDELSRSEYVGSAKYQLSDEAHLLMARMAKKARKKRWHMIVNPCGEIVLSLLGAFCTIADMVPFHCETLDEAEDCFRAGTRALMRVNLMDSIYNKEVKRTNRIGIGLTGLHEFAWKFFGCGFRDLIADFDLLMAGDYAKIAAEATQPQAVQFWMTLARFNRAVNDEAVKYAAELGVEVPHTNTTMKPAGTTSKLFNLTEGFHLPSMEFYLRWVQFRSDDPQVEQYRNNGYPVRDDLTQYAGTTIVGFPTAPLISELGMGAKLVTAQEATPEEQFKWLMLGEKFWIRGVDENAIPVAEDFGNQISYTLKYDSKLVDFASFKVTILEYQPKVRCCSVLPIEDTSAYEYLPEEEISRERYEEIHNGLVVSIRKKSEVREEVGREHVGCDNGACPVDFNSGSK